MDKDDLPSDSDQSDEDYVPDGAAELPSEEESDGEEESPEVIESGTKKRTRKPIKSKSKKQKTVPEEQQVPEEPAEPQSELIEEQKKKHEEDLWASFLGDTNPAPKRSNGVPKTETVTPKIATKPTSQPAKTVVTKIFEFAGEEIKVTKEVASDSVEARLAVKPSPGSSSGSSSSSTASNGGIPFRGRGRGGGLSSVLGQIGKKNKISVLEKSKLDWDGFKQKEGISTDIETHNKGKDG